MVLPVTPITVAQAYDNLRNQTVNVQSYCRSITSALAAGDVSAQTVYALLSAASGLASYATGLSQVSGFIASMTSYVQQQTGNSTLDVTTSYSTSLTALQALITAIVTDYPKDAAGHVLDRVMDATGAISGVSLSSAQLPNTVTAINAWLATIS